MENKTEPNYNIMLIGFMGAGKSTVSHQLCEMLKMEEIEMDAEIEKQQGMTISEIFDRYGEDYFRKAETDLLKELGTKKSKLISCGGGVVVKKENISIMKKQGPIVLLTATPKTTYERVKNSRERPILNQDMSVEFIKQLMEKRKDQYIAAADIIVKTDGKQIKEICEEIMRKIQKQ